MHILWCIGVNFHIAFLNFTQTFEKWFLRGVWVDVCVCVCVCVCGGGGGGGG